MEGLSEREAKELLQKYGYNEIVEKKMHPLLKFLSYFWGPIPWMIEAALILSAFVKHWVDFYIILVLLIVNGIVGFYQEYRAENAIELLKSKLALNAKVLRDGVWKVIPARLIVPNDVVKVRIGDIVPADIEIVEGEGEFDESALTGESLPVTKGKGDTIYSGSICRRGEVVGVVKATGMNTYFGKTAKLVEEAETVSRYQKVILKIGDYLIILAIAVIIGVILIATSRHESLIEILRFSLVLLVAAIPAALPAVMSVTMAVGAVSLAKREAIVRKLVAIEELAGVDVLCVDKTGTLTENKLTAGKPVTFEFSEEEVFKFASLASEGGDPIDDAILSIYPKPKHKLIEFKPWDPVRKRAEAVVEIDGRVIKVTKGAPQVIAEMAKTDVSKYVDELAEKGYRAIAVAVNFGNGWKIAGIIPLFDPPRKDAKETIKVAEDMGVKIKMVTGDHEAIAKQVAAILGLGQNAINAKELIEKKYPEIAKRVEEFNVFAEVFPEHKYVIVDALQKHGHIVAMTGDGVNDAPALKKADVGIAVYNATDAAKSSADIVLAKAGISVIIDAIKESRRIFQRMYSYALYRIAETVRILFFIALSIIVFNFYPVTAVMIILLALLNDIPILSIAYDNVIYSKKPDRWNMEELLVVATILGIAGLISSFALYFIAVKSGIDFETLKTFMFLKLAVAGHLTIFVTRTRKNFWSIKPGRLLFWSAIGTKLLATIFAIFGIFMTPIGFGYAALIWAYCLLWFVINDFVKIRAYKLFR